MSTTAVSRRVADEGAMMEYGRYLAAAAQPGLVVYLYGTLGAGKTTLCRGFIRAMGHSGAVKSPTYTLVEPYQLPQPVYHFDLYRLGDPEELEFMGIRDYFTAEDICLIEWPERGAGFLPPADLVITIGLSGTGRCLDMVAGSLRGEKVLSGIPSDCDELAGGAPQGE